MITSLIGMLELPNSNHMTTSTIWFDFMVRNCDVISFFQTTFFRKADIIKIAIMFIKENLKVKRIRKYILKCNL